MLLLEYCTGHQKKKRDLTYSLSSYETWPLEVLTWPCFFHQHTKALTRLLKDLIKNRLFWPGIKECGKDYFKSCSLLSQKTIQKTKQSNTKKLHFWNFWANRDWHFWTPTYHKHWSLIWNINVFDCFTKWTEAIPIPDQTLQLLLQKFFVNNYISHSWCPLQIRGINFKSKVFQDTCLCEPFQIDLTKLTKNYSPSTTIRWEHWMIPENTMLTIYLLRRLK